MNPPLRRTNWKRSPVAGRLTGPWLVAAVIILASLGRAAESASTAAGSSVRAMPETAAKPAKLHVRGYGFLGNLRLKQQLRVLRSDKAVERVLDSFLIEDAALLLFSGLQAEGYLRPAMDVLIEQEDGTTTSWRCDYEKPLELPRPLQAREVTFRLHPGTFYYFARLEFRGLTTIPEIQATTYFLVPDFLLPQKQPKLYTPDRLERGLSSLREELRRLGFRDATVVAEALDLNHATGEVTAVIRATEGRRHWVTRVEVYTRTSAGDPPLEAITNVVREAFSGRWEQALSRSLKNRQYEQGYPDTQVKLAWQVQHETAEIVELVVTADVLRGPAVRVGQISFDGLRHTRESVLRRRTRFATGDPLNPLAIEAARFQMLRLGVFDRADAAILPGDEEKEEPEEVRGVRYTVRESKPIEFSVLAGYGSYELLRVGLELEQVNLFGLAHRQRLLAAQSFKSTKLEYAYTLPQVFSPLGDLTALGFYRQREETTFTRRDYGGSLGYLRRLPGIQSELGLRLAYEQLNTRDDNFNPDYGLQEAGASAVGLTFDRNRTDNPLDPQSGYRTYATIEVATDALGGTANYGRFELGASAHLGLTRSLVLRGGLSHAFVVTPGEVRDDLPFNKRFFLGGANSVRGYVEGEAASFDAAGKLVGDESYLLGQVELEQRVTAKWSLVGFLDVAGIARDFAAYPANEVLASVGGGVRWRTPIGPVRLEYGYNLHRRDHDPVGTLHFSVGYPF